MGAVSTPPTRDRVSAPPAAGDPPDVWEEPDGRETIVAVFGGATRKGDWLPPEELRVVAGFGSVKLDLRRAELPAGVTEIDAYAVFGNVEIVVPRSLEVELNGVALLGNLEHRSASGRSAKKQIRRWLRLGPSRPPRESEGTADEEAFLSIRGTAIFGNVVLKVDD